MRFKQIVENSTTAGSVATVAQPMMTQTRESVDVKGLKPVQQVMKGKSKKKGPYANSIVEGKVKELISDLKNLTSHDFEKKHKQSKADVRADMKKVNEDDLSEQDLIVIPGQGRLRKTGFVKHDLSHGEHEGETLKNSLHTIIRVATHLDKRLSLQSEFPEWVSEKIGAVKSNMVTVMDYLISSQEMQHDTDAMEGSDRQWSKKDMERLRVATRDFDDIMASDGPEAFKQELIKKRIKTKPMAGPKGVLPEGSLNELSSALLQRAAQAATDKRNQAMDPKLHKALGGGYMNPLATHYDDVSQKISNRAAKVGKKETIQNIASKIASPAVMRKIGMNEGSQRVDSLVTDALRVMKGPEVSDAVLALKRVLGDRAYNERRGFYSFYVDQIHDMYGQQGVAEGELEEDLSRRGFLRGLGAATLGATALGAASKAQASQDLGNGFVLTTVDVFGGKFKAVLDTQSDIHYMPNRHEGGGAIVRSMAPFIMIKNGQTNTAMNVGPAVQAALKKAGLLKGVEESVAEGFDIGQEWMSDTELDQYVPERLQQQWRELLGYDRNGNPSALWANLTGGYEPDVNDPQHRRLMVKVANKWFAAKKIPNVKFFDVKDADDELEWLVQIGEQGVAEGDMYGDAEVSWEKGGRRAPTGAFRNPNFGNVLQKSVNKHNKAIVKTRQDIGSRIADIGPGGKEHNVDTDAAWDAAKKKVSEGLRK